MKIFIKIHKSHNIRPIVAICDSNLLGKKFEEGIKQLDVRENFYKGEEMNKEEVIKIIKRQTLEDASFNIVGEESIQIALEAGLINKERIHKIKGIPFTLILL